MAVRLGEWLVPSENPAPAIYGVMLIGALLAAESDRYESHLDAAASALVAALLYWLAHAYGELLGRRLTMRERLSASALRRALAHDWVLVRGGMLPVVGLLLAWAAGASQRASVTAGMWSAIACLVGFELVAALRSRAVGGELAVELAVGLALGMGIVVLKIVLH